jgi:uncharacterized membrane protein (DUF2068 family)
MRLYLRLLSVLYFAGALLHIADILELRLKFSEMTPVWKGWVLYLTLMDLAAAVGLWRNQKWGANLFLLVAGSQLTAYLGFRQIFGNQMFLLLFHSLTLVGYFGILFKEKQRALAGQGLENAEPRQKLKK